MNFSFTASDAVQILILYLVIYAILRYARGSRFGQVLAGIGILGCLLVAFTFLFHFDVLARIVQFLLAYLAFSTVVIFQPEIRRFLAAVGALSFLDRPRRYDAAGGASPELLADCVFELAKRRLGALLAFERGISLRGYERSGIPVEALASPELLVSVFTPPLPLHDGGVVVRNGRLSSAHCLFPVSNQPALAASGMRHRAAVGLTEETDALVVVVSEETGRVSVAHNGRLLRYPEAEARKAVQRWIAKALPEASARPRPNPAADWLRRAAGVVRRALAPRPRPDPEEEQK